MPFFIAFSASARPIPEEKRPETGSFDVLACRMYRRLGVLSVVVVPGRLAMDSCDVIAQKKSDKRVWNAVNNPIFRVCFLLLVCCFPLAACALLSAWFLSVFAVFSGNLRQFFVAWSDSGTCKLLGPRKILRYLRPKNRNGTRAEVVPLPIAPGG